MALKGVKVIEMLGLAPGPFCGNILADFGASVTVVHKTSPAAFDVLSNGKRSISINLKSQEGIEIFKKLTALSDVILDTYRPGVMEKLGLGPHTLMQENKGLIYARLSGYGQTGFYKDKAGHDINYVAMSGLLSLLSKNKEPPVPPINLLADFAGGSYCCAMGILLALYERTKSQQGQIVDCSMTEGAAYLGTWLFKSRSLPIWANEPGSNMLDGGAPFYCTYETRDKKFMAVGALEPQFYKNFLVGLGLSEEEFGQLSDMDKNKKEFEKVFLKKTQREWTDIFDKLDACVTPVLDIGNVSKHEHNKTRQYFFSDKDHNTVPEPAPRLSRTCAITTGNKPLPAVGEHTVEILKELNYTKDQIQTLMNKGCIYAETKCNL